jgi:hypothetical protein
MRTFAMTILTLLLGLSLLAPAALAREMISPQKARAQIAKYYQKRGWTGDFTARTIRMSSTGKSRQMAVANTNGGKTRLFNVHNITGRVSMTPTGLVKQSTARGIANLQLRHERAPYKGAFSGVNSAGLSASGQSHKMRSATDANEAVYVKLTTGKTRHFDGPYPKAKAPVSAAASTLR